MLRVFVVLLFGSLAAPAIYIVLGFVSPAEFHDLRGADISLIGLTFGAAWLFSFLLTFVVGATCWWPMHARRIDGFASYAAVGAIAYAVVYGVSGAGDFRLAPLLLGLGLAIANAVLVRGLERLVAPPGARSNSTPHSDARDVPALASAAGARAGGRER